MFRENRPENGSGKHENEHHIEQPAIDQALTCVVERIEGDQCAASVAATCGSVSDQIVIRAIGE